MQGIRNKVPVAILVAVLLAFVAAPSQGFAATPYSVGATALSIDGQPVTLVKPVLVVGGRSLLPMRSFFEMLGAKVTWDEPTQTAIAAKDGHTLAFPVNSQTIQVDGQSEPVDVPAQVIDGSTYVPIRAAAENFGYDVTWSAAGIQLFERAPSFIQGIEHFSRAWSMDDRSHFANLLTQVQANPAVVLHQAFVEYQDLSRAIEKLDGQAYHSKRGYVLYSPALTTETNSVWTAMTARTRLLEDVTAGKGPASLDTYYPRSYWYQQVDQNVFQIPEFTDFTAFDQQAAVNLLENLQIPDYVLYGLRINYVPGYSPTASGYNSATGLMGHFGDHIVVFDEKAPASWVIETIAHEVGHSVGKDAFYQWSQSIVVPEENQAAEKAYAVGIHNQADYALRSDGPWGTDISENFADDFMHLVTGMDKVAAWRDVHDAQIRDFINTRVTPGLYQKRIPLIQEMEFVVDGTAVPFLNEPDWGNLDKDHYLVTSQGQIQLKALGYVPGAAPLGVTVGDQEFLFDANGVCKITLPQKGQVYELKVGVFSPELREYYFRLPVLYGDF
ncbi:MAG: copper amine oxidase N-terminal domain-containing protein [Symbiobacteriia bacterium]